MRSGRHNDQRILVTGAAGFVGTALVRVLRAHGGTVRAVGRSALAGNRTSAAEYLPVGPIDARTDWSGALDGVATVIHLAARVHVMRESATNPLAEFRRVNVAGSERLAAQAAARGVRRLVYVSSIKVNGELTHGRPFSDGDVPNPQDAYALSKLEAENVLRRIGMATGLEVVIVRPPLVYGPGVKGNFLSLLRLVDAGFPLPFARCDNRRSFIGVTNLAELLAECARNPAAVGATLLAADGEDLSTPELVRRMAAALGRPARLLPIPTVWLSRMTRLIGRRGWYDRLCGSLQIDASAATRLLGWRPPRSVDAELEETARWYRQQRRGGDGSRRPV